MKIAIASQPKYTSSASIAEQALFDKLWAKVKKQKQANEKLQASLAELAVIYQEKILPAEKQLFSPYSQLILKLLDFFRRKSLSQWQRQELGVWIMENIETITPLDQEKSRELVEEYYQVLANHLDMDVEELQEQMQQADSFDDFDEFFENFAGIFDEDKAQKTPDKEHLQHDLFGCMEEELEPATAQEAVVEKSDIGDGDKWLKTLFRRTANALHPDKEQNETLKAHKQQLMASLLAARESNDIYTIVSLYTEHVDASDMLVEQDVMVTVCQQLQQQLHTMKEAHYQYLNQNPVYSALYKTIYHSNKKTQAKNIEQYVMSIAQQAEDIASLSHSIRNLTDLKEILKYRFEQDIYDEEWPERY